MSIDSVFQKAFEEDVGGAFIHGLSLPYFLTPEIPRLIKNFKNQTYPDEVFKNKNFEEYHKTHLASPHRFTARTLGVGISIYATMGLVQIMDFDVSDVLKLLVVSNVSGILYSSVPDFKKFVKAGRDLTMDFSYALSTYFL